MVKWKGRRRDTKNNPFHHRNINCDNFFDSDIEDKNVKNKKGKAQKKANSKDEVQNTKDFGLQIFHALGKMLYNKRIDPKTGKTRAMTTEELKKKPQPKLYFKHEDILNQVQTEDTTFSLFLHENLIDFAGDIEDVAKILEVYSHNDAITSSARFSYAEQAQLADLSHLSSLTEWMATTTFNLHPSPSSHLHKMRKPQLFTLTSSLPRTNSTLLWAKSLPSFAQTPLRQLATSHLPLLQKLGQLKGEQMRGARELVKGRWKEGVGLEEVESEEELDEEDLKDLVEEMRELEEDEELMREVEAMERDGEFD
jgi:hypothetical protein